jgi:transcriptional regulator of heat shock response
MKQETLQSPSIFENLKDKNFKNCKSINDMLLLFRLMKKNKLSHAEGHVYFLLRNKYEDAYVNLLREMNPFKYQIYLEEQEKLLQQKETSHQNKIERQQELIEQEKKEYQEWLMFQKRA